jgi:DNA-binding protein Fis
MNSAVESFAGERAGDEPIIKSEVDELVVEFSDDGPVVEPEGDELVVESKADEPVVESNRTDTLIKAALSLSQAIEALGSLNLFGELQPPDVKHGIDFYAEVRRFEVALITEALRITHGSQTRASALLGLHPTTLNCMIKRFDVNADPLANNPGERSPRGRRTKKPPPASIMRHDLAPAR